MPAIDEPHPYRSMADERKDNKREGECQHAGMSCHQRERLPDAATGNASSVNARTKVAARLRMLGGPTGSGGNGPFLLGTRPHNALHGIQQLVEPEWFAQLAIQRQ